MDPFSEWQASRTLGMKGKIGHWAVVKSAGSKGASVVNMEYMWIGLVICGGSS